MLLLLPLVVALQGAPVQDSARVRPPGAAAETGAKATPAGRDTTRTRSVNIGVRIGVGDGDSLGTARRRPVSARDLETAFRDPGARELLQRARAARLRQDSLLRSYDAMSFTRLSVGLGFKALARDRLLFRSENASRVRWDRARGAVVEVRGSRAVLPMGGKAEQDEVQADMSDVYDIPYYPGQEPMWIGGANGLARAEVDDRNIVHPIATGSEAYYTFATGDTVVMTLPDGRALVLKELRAEARVPRWNAVVGSFWFDRETAQLVRAVYRLSVPMDLWALAREDSSEVDVEMPRVVKPLLSPLRAEVSVVSLEYGLYEQRFWLPRLRSAEGGAQVGFMRVPFGIEQRFRYATVNGMDTLPPMPVSRLASWRAVRDSLRTAGVDSVTRRRMLDSIQARNDTLSKAARDSACKTAGTYKKLQSRFDGTMTVLVELPCDAKLLATSPDLPGSIYGADESVFGKEDLEVLKRSLGFDLQAGWAPRPPVWEYGTGWTRYNRVEGLSTGAGAAMALGRGYTARGGARYGFGDRQVNGELSLERGNGRSTLRGGVYRRLETSSDYGTPLGFGASVVTLFNARDEGFYYRTWGGEVGGTHPRFGSLQWRLYGEAQWTAPVTTRFTVMRGQDDRRFIDNVTAARATQVGAQVRVRDSWGLDPRGWRATLDVRMDGSVGTFDHGRGIVDLTVARPLVGGLGASLTGAVGAVAGEAPPQRQFFLGGLHTVRGQTAGTAVGDAFWLARLELARPSGWVRPVLFGDLGWAGSRADWSRPGRPLSGVGAGMSVLDGAMRVDVSRGLWPREQWRLDWYLEARF